MSIQWTFVAGYLYLEIGIVIILMLPIASPRKWNIFFKSRLFAIFQDNAIYFYMWLCILGLFFMDAFREMRKYSHPVESDNASLANDMKNSIKLFRAQRNFYITSFAIFLAFVIRRLITMIIIQAEMLEKSIQIIQEAEKAKELAKTTVLAHTIHSAGTGDSNASELQAQLESVQYLLNEEKNKTKFLEEQINQWKSKYGKISDIENDK